MAALLVAQLFSQSRVELLPHPIDAPQPEVVVHALPGWKVVRQRFPQAAVLGHIKDSIEYLSPGVKARTTGAFGFGQQWRDYLPFVIIEVSRVGFSGLIASHSPSLPDCPLFD